VRENGLGATRHATRFIRHENSNPPTPGIVRKDRAIRSGM
jgi:hypothetical protein